MEVEEIRGGYLKPTLFLDRPNSTLSTFQFSLDIAEDFERLTETGVEDFKNLKLAFPSIFQARQSLSIGGQVEPPDSLIRDGSYCCLLSGPPSNLLYKSDGAN